MQNVHAIFFEVCLEKDIQNKADQTVKKFHSHAKKNNFYHHAHNKNNGHKYDG